MSRVIARPYAKAINDLALDFDSKKKWDAFLKNLSDLVEVQEIKDLFLRPFVTDKSKINVLISALKITDKQQINFINCLLNNKRIFIIRYIAEIFGEILASCSHELKAVVDSRLELTKKEKELIQRVLKNKFGNNVLVSYQEDQSILAGVKIKVGDWIGDLSVNGYLNDLRTKLLG